MSRGEVRFGSEGCDAVVVETVAEGLGDAKMRWLRSAGGHWNLTLRDSVFVTLVTGHTRR